MNIKFIKHLAKTGKSPYFFSKKTMEFFNSKVYPDVAATEKGYQFITSESFGENHLRFSLRHIDFEGRIETLFTRKSYEKIKMLMIS
tara:strand:+ start:314 stop:574 length:261 start_codon:yes stop_codon:yes gene_type:complete